MKLLKIERNYKLTREIEREKNQNDKVDRELVKENRENVDLQSRERK